MRAAGIAQAFVGVTLQSLGLVLQKKAQNEGTELKSTHQVSSTDPEENESDDDDEDSLDLPKLNLGEDDIEYLKSNTWRFGFGLFLCGSVLCFVSLGWIGPSLVSERALVL